MNCLKYSSSRGWSCLVGITRECKGEPISTLHISRREQATIFCVGDPTLATPTHKLSSDKSVNENNVFEEQP